MESYKYMNLFSGEGKLLQVDYALEGLRKFPSTVVVRTPDRIYVAKKKDCSGTVLKQEEELIKRVGANIYVALSGIDSDEIQWLMESYVVDCKFKLGYDPSADIIAKKLAEAVQRRTQSNGRRNFSFSALLFGFEFGRPYVYYVDNSGIALPYVARGMGAYHERVNGFFAGEDAELRDGSLLCMKGLTTALGENFNITDVCFAEVNAANELSYYSLKDIDTLTVKVHEDY